MMGQTEQDSGKTYADMWGEAVHSNRHLRVLSMGLAGLVLLLVVIIIRLSSVELPKPIVVRVDEVGRAEALAYDAVEAQADPLDSMTKYFLNRWIDQSRRLERARGDGQGPDKTTRVTDAESERSVLARELPWDAANGGPL